MDKYVAICKEIFGMLETDPNILTYIIMGDETWASHYNPPLKQETYMWNFPGEARKEKVR